MQTINLFGHDLVVRNTLCKTKESPDKYVNPSLRLYIKITDGCQAGCVFCANENNKDFGNIDLKKIEFIIRYLLDRNLLHGVSITGGEPLLDTTKLFKLLDLIYSIDKTLEVQISTNGYNLRRLLEYDDINRLESIHISRHHFEDKVNYEIFRSDLVASTDDILYLQDGLDDKKIININTMVMKDYIDDIVKIKAMLNYVGDIGVYKNGFVSLMKCNEWAINHFINFNDMFKNLDDSFFLAHHFYTGEYCECLDGLYLTDKNKLVEYYARMVKECNCPYTTQLVYTSDNRLTAGFGKKLLYK